MPQRQPGELQAVLVWHELQLSMPCSVRACAAYGSFSGACCSSTMLDSSKASDAVVCLEKFFTYLELHLQHRVHAKTGGEHVALQCHSSKAHTLLPPGLTKHADDTGLPISAEQFATVLGAAERGTARCLSPAHQIMVLRIGSHSCYCLQRSKLRPIFIFYCGLAERSNYMFMSCSQFLRCCRDAQLVQPPLDNVALTLLFNKVLLELESSAPGERVTMHGWLQAMQLVAAQVYPELQLPQAWEKVAQDHLLKHASKASSEDELGQVILDAGLLETLYKVKRKLLPIFQHYVQQQCVSVPQRRQRRPQPVVATTLNTLSRPASVPCGSAPSKPTSPSPLPTLQAAASALSLRHSSSFGMDPAFGLTTSWPSGLDTKPPATGTTCSQATTAVSAATSVAAQRRRSTVAVQQARAQMPLVTFLRFLLDFKVVPDLLNKPQATACFRAARMGMRCEKDAKCADALDRVTFAEFLDAVGRCALVAFHFKLPQEPETLLSFSDSYHRGAKLLWSSAAVRELATNMAYGDELHLPETTRDWGISNEDQPHYEEHRGRDDMLSTWGARSAKSRTGGIFRTARSLAQYKIKRQDGGAEVMQLFDGSGIEDDRRPMHLKPFSPDWVGKPSLPLSETAQLTRCVPADGAQGMGIYNGEDIWLPPVYMQRAQQMVEARNVREQALEALKLTYVSQRREEQRRKRAALAQQRQLLQFTACQRVLDGPVSSPQASVPYWDGTALLQNLASSVEVAAACSWQLCQGVQIV